MKNEVIVDNEYGTESDATTLLLTYMLVDRSLSMEGEAIQAVNRVLPELHRTMLAHPALSDKVRLSVIAFAETAVTVVPLSDLAEVEYIPELVVEPYTNYAKAFAYLRDCIERDVAALKAAGFGVYRPAVFFISDGGPTDTGWEAEFAKLVDPEWKLHPNVVSFGFGQADETVISHVSTLAAYMADSGVSATGAIDIWARTLLQSMLHTAGTGVLAVPANVQGFHQVGESPAAAN